MSNEVKIGLHTKKKTIVEQTSKGIIALIKFKTNSLRKSLKEFKRTEMFSRTSSYQVK